MLVAIHQPNFLPWLGFFDKLKRADIFILLDSVALQRTGSNYTNRVRMLVSGKPAWVTVPLARGAEARERVADARIAENPSWRNTLRRTVEQSYGKAPFFAETMPIVERMLAAGTSALCAVNVLGIEGIAAALGLGGKRMVRASGLAAEGSSTDLLAALVRAVGGSAYLTGHGAGYQDDGVFAAAGIAIERQDYRVPAYEQVDAAEFVPGLSAIDALMNCGPAAAGLVG
jgi:hypothetical protein